MNTTCEQEDPLSCGKECLNHLSVFSFSGQGQWQQGLPMAPVEDSIRIVQTGLLHPKPCRKSHFRRSPGPGMLLRWPQVSQA